MHAPISSTFKLIEPRPLTATIGAEIHGVDLASDWNDALIGEIREALLQYKVIFFRDQDISTERHIEFGKRFGELEIHPGTAADQPNREILHLVSGPGQPPGADVWHADTTFRSDPAMGSILRSRVIPPLGGDTLWADMGAAFRGLSTGLQDWLRGLEAAHDIVFGFAKKAPLEKVLPMGKQFPPVAHPMVRTHPETGEELLFVNGSFTKEVVGLPEAESRWLLDFLFEQVHKPEFQVRFRWTENAIAFWDNRACQHYAAWDYGENVRKMERVAIIGDEPFYRPAA